MACYSDDRWNSIEAALASLRKQDLEPREVIVAVDNNEPLARRVAENFDWVSVVVNHGPRGASATRNRGVEGVRTPLTAFLDDDEVAEPGWLAKLVEPFDDAHVVGTGGRYAEAWLVPKPGWFPDEFAWVVGGSYLGMPTVTSPVRNVWSGNMAVRTEIFRAVDGFRTNFGKQGSQSQPEDTDLCIRMAAAGPGQWMYVPSAIIDHEVPTERASLSFFAKRCFSEGRGKYLMRDQFDTDSVIDTERDYAWAMVRRILTRIVTLDPASFVQALVIMLGLACAVAGYSTARLTTGRADDDQTAVGEPHSERKPARVADLELASPIELFLAEHTPGLNEYDELWVLVRLFGTPIAMLDLAVGDIESLQVRLLDTVAAECTDSIGRLLAYDRHRIDSVRRGLGCEPGESIAAKPVSSGGVTVAICTRNRPDELSRLLESLTQQTYPRFTVVIADNAPTDRSTRAVADRFRSAFDRLDYVVEPAPGLSRARNRALAAVDTEIVAWLDDDEIADPHWLASIMGRFHDDATVTAVSGSVVPAELETLPQMWFEQFGGHTKGRGFSEVTFVNGDTGAQSPVYPLPSFGAGANMAIRTAALRELDGFDVALGAGTATFGGEDTLLFSQLLLSKRTIVFAPEAITRHFHRKTYVELEKQMHGYGVGLTAYYVALLRWRWTLLFTLVMLVPRAARDVLRSDGASKASVPDDFPEALLRLKAKAMLSGPTAYIAARRTSRESAGS